MNVDIREAITSEASRAPAPELDLASIERRGTRRRRVTRASQGLGIVGLIVAMASVAAMLGGNAPGADLADPDVADDSAVVTDSSVTRLLDLPFEPGSVVEMGGRIFATAASSTDMTEPSQVYASDDKGETWELVFELDGEASRFTSVAASGDLLLLTGGTLFPPVDEEPPFVNRTIRIDEAGETTVTRDPSLVTGHLVAVDGGFVGVVYEYPNCRMVTSSDGETWSDAEMACPDRLGAIYEVNGHVIGIGGAGQMWILRDGEFAEIDLPLEPYADLLGPIGDQDLFFGSVGADHSGQIVASARLTYMVGDTSNVERQEVLVAHSSDGGQSWLVNHITTADESYPWGITGLDHGFVTVVAGEVLVSDDGVNWAPTGQRLPADLWSWQPGVVVGDRVLVPVGPAAQSANASEPRRMAVIELD
jgi:hypothetical protein